MVFLVVILIFDVGLLERTIQYFVFGLCVVLVVMCTFVPNKMTKSIIKILLKKLHCYE